MTFQILITDRNGDDVITAEGVDWWAVGEERDRAEALITWASLVDCESIVIDEETGEERSINEFC